MKILEAKNIVKRFPGVVALDNVDISLDMGKIHCITGENGAGKSTLVKVLLGIESPDEGEISIQGVNALSNKEIFKKIAYVPQELNLLKYMTVAENLFIPFQKSIIKSPIVRDKDLFKQAAYYLQKFRINAKPGDLIADISVSDQQLLQIAHAVVNQNAAIIMLDEPTTSLSPKDIGNLFEVLNELKKEKKAIVFISHKLEEVFAIGDEITVLRNGIKDGHKEIKDANIQWVIKQMTGREIDESALSRPENTSREVVLDVENLTGEIFSNISFKLHKGEVLGFAGLVGAGRTDIMKTIFGYLPAWGGKVWLDDKPWKLGDTSYSVNNGLIYISEERSKEGILLLLSVKENISMPLLRQIMNWFVISNKKEQKLVNKVIDKYQIKTSSIDNQIKFLSGGNQQKVIIGRSLFCNPRVLIFDEPTKGIDVGAKAEIYKIMKHLADEVGVGIILISSEIEEIMRCSNRIITIYDGKKTGEFEASETGQSTIMNSMVGLKKS